MSNDTRFKPGQSGNPNGRPPVAGDVLKIRKVTNDEIKEVGSLLLESNEQGIVELANNDETPMLKKWITEVALKGKKNGDMGTLNALLDRIVGKVKDVVQVELPKPTVIERLDGTSVELGAVMEKDSEG